MTWENITDASTNGPSPRDSAGLVAVGEALYLFGGKTDSGTLPRSEQILFFSILVLET